MYPEIMTGTNSSIGSKSNAKLPARSHFSSVAALILLVFVASASLRQYGWEPDVLAGQPVIRGTRLGVEFVIGLGGTPDMNEPLAPKAKWKHRKTYRKVRNQVQLLESAIKPAKRCKSP